MDKRAEDTLRRLADEDNLRTLTTLDTQGTYVEHEGRRYLNLSSNDYLGITSDREMQREFFEAFDPSSRFVMSNPSSRLMTGNSAEYEQLEGSIAELFGGDRRSIVLSSGFLVNAGVLPAITSKGDLILADKLVHASIIEGMRLSAATHLRFNHNDMEHLRALLEKYRDSYDQVWVVTESVFSMDGDCAPLAELVSLKERYGLRLYLDEAHAFGVYGSSGAGLADSLGLAPHFDIIVATLGKAAAACGGFVVCSESIRELLINRMRTLIFSTALPPINLRWSQWVIDRLPQMGARRERLAALSQIVVPAGDATHIVPLMTHDNARALELCRHFRSNGYWITAVRWPTVPKGESRLRLSLNAAIEPGEITKFMVLWNSIG